MVLITVGGRIVASAVHVVVVELKEWDSGYFSAYIFWLNGGF